MSTQIDNPAIAEVAPESMATAPPARSSVLLIREARVLVVKLPVCAVQNEVLVPFAEEFVKKFDVAGKRIDMEVPEGLLEVDQPLSAEEKERQKSEADEARAAGERRKGK